MAGTKESQLTVKTSVLDTDFVRLFTAGQNFAASFSDFKSALGVTGTLNQVGDPLGVPIYTSSCDGVNNFRNLESSKGMIFNVSARNGILGGCNFKQGSSGVPVITDLNAKQYQFKTLVAGAGITLTDNGDNITISLT